MTYEYACGACAHEWEAEQSIRDQPIKKCPKCGKLQAKRQISRGAGFILKGGGWYADGYGSASAGSSKKTDETSTNKPTADKPTADNPAKPSGDKPADGGGSSGEKASGSGDSKGKTAAA